MPPSLIYKGDSQSLQDTWLEDWTPEHTAHFAASPNGWSCNVLGLNWLQTVFDRYTHCKAGNRRRLLIVDGHSSYVNMAFINECDRLRILLIILPPHTTHRIQPLDVLLFQPLATYYTNGLNDLLFNSLGIMSISKRAFFKVFWPAWQQAFSVENIESGFRRTGIWPCNSAIMLATLKIPEPPTTNKLIKTPVTCRTARRVQKIYTRAPTSALLAKIFEANLRLAAQHAIDLHMQNNLIEALKQEKKRRQQGKRLNLLGIDDNGPQFFSPSWVQAARDYQTSKDADEAERQQGILNRKVDAAAKKLQKEKEKEEKAENAAVRRQLQVETAAQKAAKKLALQQAKQTAAALKKQQLATEKLLKIPKKAGKQRKTQAQIVNSDATAPEAEVVISGTSRTRTIHRPKRYVH